MFKIMPRCNPRGASLKWQPAFVLWFAAQIQRKIAIAVNFQVLVINHASSSGCHMSFFSAHLDGERKVGCSMDTAVYDVGVIGAYRSIEINRV